MPKKVIIPAVDDGWDPVKEEFYTVPETRFTIEHSLVSISKWESTWQKPFLKTKNKTPEEMLDYIRCMTLTQNVKPDVYARLTPEIINDIWAYVESPMSATVIMDPAEQKEGQAPSREVITSELIYSWMVEHKIPFECQKWHLNRLMNLIKILNKRAKTAANNGKPTMSKRELMQRNRALNAQRRARLHSKG